MNNSYVFIIIFFCLFIVLMERRRKIEETVRAIQRRKKKRGAYNNMKELILEYIDKECIVYTVNGQHEGIIKRVADGGVIIEINGSSELLNLDYIVRVREYPKKKNGKKKAIVLD